MASSHGARIHTSRSSSVVRITGICLGVDRLDHGVRLRRQEAIDPMRSRYRLRLGASLGPHTSEGRERSIVIEGKPDHVLFLGLRIWLRRVFGEAVERDQATIFPQCGDEVFLLTIEKGRSALMPCGLRVKN